MSDNDERRRTYIDRNVTRIGSALIIINCPCIYIIFVILRLMKRIVLHRRSSEAFIGSTSPLSDRLRKDVGRERTHGAVSDLERKRIDMFFFPLFFCALRTEGKL